MHAEVMSWDWAAGFFDGEGCVTWYKPRPPSTRSYAVVTIGQKMRDPLAVMRGFLLGNGLDSVGLSFRPAGKSKSARGKPVAIWVLTIAARVDVIKFLTEIAPRAIVKREKATFVLARLVELEAARRIARETAIHLREQGSSWKEIKAGTGISGHAVRNYMRVIGHEGIVKSAFSIWEWRKQRMAKGLCYVCGRARDDASLAQRCRSCQNKHNACKQRWRERQQAARREIELFPPCATLCA